MNNLLKIAVISPGALGGLIMITPALRSLRSIYPDAVIDVFCGSQYETALKNNPNISEIKTFYLKRLCRSGMREKISEAAAIVSELKNYDISYTLTRDVTMQSLSFIAKVKKRFSPGSSVFAQNAYKPEKDMHLAEVYVNTVMQNSISGKASMKYEFYPDPSQIELPAAKYIAIAPGGGANAVYPSDQRRWDKYTELVKKILVETEFDVALLGLKEDRIELPDTHRVKDYTGKTTLSDCFRIIENAERFVGNDSGLTQLAACTKTPVTAIYGPTNFLLTRPYNHEKSQCVTPPLDCGPCIKNSKIDCEDNVCMKAISVDEVFQSVVSD